MPIEVAPLLEVAIECPIVAILDPGKPADSRQASDRDRGAICSEQLLLCCTLFADRSAGSGADNRSRAASRAPVTDVTSGRPLRRGVIRAYLTNRAPSKLGSVVVASS